MMEFCYRQARRALAEATPGETRLETDSREACAGLRISDFGNVAEAGMIQVFYQRRKKTRPRLAPGIFGSIPYAQPCFDEGTDQPRPNRALMIRAIALTHAASIVWHVTRLLRREGA